MSAQKRSTNLHQDGEKVSLNQSHRRRQSRRGDISDQATSSRRPPALQSPQKREIPNKQQQIQDQPFLGDRKSDEKNSQEDSDESGTDPEDFDEVVRVLQSQVHNNDFNERDFFAQLFEARKDVECPICLGIIKKTRTVMGCLHRFCQECIDKSMRLGNHECPSCRKRCASRRSLRDDPLFDSLINAMYPDAQKYEQEELLPCEEDQTRNKQIQASIAEVSRLQQEASITSHRLGADDTSPIENDCTANESPSGARIRQRRRRRSRTGILPATTSPPATARSDGGSFVVETISPPLPVFNQEILSWGRGGARSHTRNGSASSSRAEYPR